MLCHKLNNSIYCISRAETINGLTENTMATILIIVSVIFFKNEKHCMALVSEMVRFVFFLIIQNVTFT